MSHPTSDPDARTTTTDGPAASAPVAAPASASSSYDATPLAGPTAPYSSARTASDPGPRRRRGLLIGGVAAASLLVLGLTFGGGVVLGTHLAGPGAFTAFEQGGFPGGDRPEPPDGFGPGSGEQGLPGGQDGQSDGDGSTSDGGATS